jgi:PAS domain S-box-containing protein
MDTSGLTVAPETRLAALERLSRRWAALNAVIVRGLEAGSSEELLPIVTAALKAADIDSYVALLAEGGTHLKPVHSSRNPEELATLRRLSGTDLFERNWPLASLPVMQRALTTRSAQYVADRRELTRALWSHLTPAEVEGLAETMGGRRAIVAPLVTSTAELGTLVVLADDLTPDDTTPVSAFAHHLAAALERLELQAEMRANAEELTALYRINRIISSTLDLRQIQLTFGAEFRKLIPFERGTIWLFEEEGRYARFYANLMPGQPYLPESELVPTAGLILGKIYRDRQPVVVADLAASPRGRASEQLLASGIRSFLLLPLRSGERMIGCLSLGAEAANTYAEEQLARLLPVAEQLALALTHAQLYAEAREARERAEALAEVSQRLASELDYRRLLELIAQHAHRFANAAYAYVAVPEDEVYRAAAIAGEAPEYLRRITFTAEPDQTGGRGPGGEALRTLRTVVLADARRHPSEFVRRFSLQNGIGSTAAVPLLYSGRPLGLLVVQASRPRAFDAPLVALLESFAHQGAIAVQNALLYRELGASEERYRMVVENAHDLIIATDREGRFTFINERARDMLGYAPDELLGRPFFELVAPAMRKLARENFERAMADWSALDTLDLQLVRRDGATVDVELNVATLYQDGRPAGRQGILRDVTERNILQQRLREAETQRALGQLASGVAHDFNNVLGLVLGRTELLLQHLRRGNPSPESIASALAVIQQAAMDGAQTVRRLQEFTRTQPPTEAETVDINEVLHTAVALTAPRWRDAAQENGIPIQVEMRAGAVPSVAGNTSELREVLTNLIFNAVDAMPRGGHIVLESRLNGTEAEIRVSDTGLGMAEEVRRRVFEPFFTTKGTRGSGLGLSMAHSIIQRHGGTITVDSAPGQGSRFVIRLPAGSAAPSVATPHAPQPARAGRILAIDDEPGLLQVLRMILEDEGHALTICANGAEGVAEFRERLGDPETRFNLVLTDLGMPGMNGWEVAQAIGALDPSVPVALITGWGTQLDPEKMRESGVKFVLGKPYHLEDVQRLVADALAAGGSPLPLGEG